MAKETMDKIRAAESAAETAEADARRRAADMIAKAKADGAELVDKKCAEAENAADELIRKAKIDADKIIDDAEKASDKPEISSSKKDEAIKACLEKLIREV